MALSRPLTLFALWCLHPLVVAQEPAPQPMPAEQETVSKPLDISGRSQEALSRLGVVENEVSEVAPTGEVAEWLAAQNAELDTEFGPLDGVEARMASLSASEFEDLVRRLNERRERGGVRAGNLDKVALALEERIQELASTIETWRQIRESETGIPEALATRITDILDRATRVHDEAQAHLNEIAQLQNDVIALRGRLDAVMERVKKHQEERRGALFKFQHPPLWMVDTITAVGAYRQTGSEITNRWLSDATTFLDDNAAAVVLHVATLIVVLLAIRALRASAIRGGVDPEETRLLRRPFSSGLLAVLLMQEFFYPAAPSTIGATFGAVAAITAVVVVHPFLSPAMRRAMITLVALYILDRTLSLFATGAPMYRLVLLAIETAMAVLIVIASQRSYTDVLQERGLRRAITAPTFGVGLLLVVLAAGLNVLGNIELAALITGGVVRALLLLIVVFTLYLIVNEAVALLVRPGFVTRFRTIVRHREAIEKGARGPILVVAVVAWVTATASFFGVLSPALDAIREGLSAEARVGDISVSLGRVVAFALAVWVAMLASRLTRALLEADVLPRFALPRGVPNTIATTVNYIIVLIGFMIGAGFLGIDLTSLGLILGALGVGIGFGLQNVVNNFVSGLILVFERPIQVGDVVEVNALFGTVTQIGLRASRVRTFGGSEIIVPNGDLVSQQVTNWTLSDRRRRLEIPVGVAYRSDPEQVHAVLTEAVVNDEDVLDDPAPMVVFEAFGDSALEYRVYAWIGEFDQGFTIRNKLNTTINTALREAGIEIPYPQRDLHLRSIQTDDALHVVDQGGTPRGGGSTER